MAGNKQDKSTSSPTTKARKLSLVVEKGQTIDQAAAAAALGPELTNASTFVDYMQIILPDLSLDESVKGMAADIKAVNGGNLDKLEGMLTAQAIALNAIFNHLAKKSMAASYLPQTDTFMRLALRAQSQCRTTAETISEIKLPKSATFIRQANIANQQQVNNGMADSESSTHAHACGQEKSNQANELLRMETYATLDSGRAAAAGRANQELEAVGEVDRAKDASWQGRFGK